MSNLALCDAVRKRTHKTLTTTIEQVNKLVSTTEMNVAMVWKEDLLEKWNQYFSAFELHEKTLVGNDDDKSPVLPKITEEFIQAHNAFIIAKVHVQKLLTASVGTSQANTSAFFNESHIQIDAQSKPLCKLPPIRITPFAGDSNEWLEFKATCSKVLTEELPDVQKLQILKDSLIGEPRNIVSHILPGEGSYAKAFELLKVRYENYRTIVNDALRKFFAIPYIETPTADAFRSMLNVTNGLLATLSSSNIDTKSWDAILIFTVTQRFDATTIEAWEEKMNGRKTIPPLQVLVEFLEARIAIRSGMGSGFANQTQAEKQIKSFVKLPPRPHVFANNNKDSKVKSFFTLKSEYKCVLCGRNHLPSRCDEIVRIPVRDRHALIKQHNLCFNCFYPHTVRECPFIASCKRCSEPHHTLLHLDSQKVFMNLTDEVPEVTKEGDSMSKQGTPDDALSQISAHYFYHIKENDDALLATAIVPVCVDGRSAVMKTLIDQGSTTNLITTRACRLLNLRFIRNKSTMFGVGNTPVGHVLGCATFEINSIHSRDFKLSINAIVVQNIGEVKGVNKEVTSEWKHLTGLALADPNYFEANRIDMLLGAATHADIILDGLKKGKQNEPIAQFSVLGWIVSGHMNATQSYNDFCRLTMLENSFNKEKDLNDQLRLFWEMEEVTFTKHLTAEEQQAEEVFKNSVKRSNDGKFVIDLPFKTDPFQSKCFGESRFMAEKRYKSLQRRFERDSQLKQKYDEVLEEYLTLGHMKLVDDNPKFQYFLPHHAVVKETSSTTKVRTVFDASAKSSNGVSLNDNLCVGPTIQPELFELLIQWRKYEFAISGDIEKMYRMFWVNPDHANFQTILWQRPGTDSIQEYKLLTVTFGTGSAPFQAVRGVFEIGERVKEKNPQLAESIQKNFYVDDYLKSFPSIESAIRMREELTTEFADYGLRLRKWKSNDERTLQNIDDVDKEEVSFDSTLKTLGISWQPNTDCFVFKSSEAKQITQWTKRKILSEIAKLFDPLGWLAPCTAKARILMQDVWRLPQSFSWDSELPDHIMSQWLPILSDLIAPIPIQVPRWLKLSNQDANIEVHGFCDASNLAYAACVYLRITHKDGTVSCNLVAAKTKVAPIRSVTIPRLELCGAVLLAKLMKRCCQALSLNECHIQTWSDSKIVLAWISTHPSKWVTFVANRVSEIQQTCESSKWLHIPTKQNPADIASRGTLMHELKKLHCGGTVPSFCRHHPNKAQRRITNCQSNRHQKGKSQ